MNSILFTINILNFLLLLLLYPKTALESVQKYSLLVGISTSRLNNNDTLTDNVAAISSSLGIEIYFKGLSIDFPISKI